MRTHATRSARLTVRLAPGRREELRTKYAALAESYTRDADLWRREGDTRFAEELEACAGDYARAAEELA